jgi:hypothetical protein
MVSLKKLIELEWDQVFGQHPKHTRKPWGLLSGAESSHSSSLRVEGTPYATMPPVNQVIHDLESARLRHLMHLTRQHPYHAARTNCRWHETRHQPSQERGSRHA